MPEARGPQNLARRRVVPPEFRNLGATSELHDEEEEVTTVMRFCGRRNCPEQAPTLSHKLFLHMKSYTATTTLRQAVAAGTQAAHA